MTIRINGILVQGDEPQPNGLRRLYAVGTKVLFVNYVESTYRFDVA